jgi:hypothetical protein
MLDSSGHDLLQNFAQALGELDRAVGRWFLVVFLVWFGDDGGSRVLEGGGVVAFVNAGAVQVCQRVWEVLPNPFDCIVADSGRAWGGLVAAMEDGMCDFFGDEGRAVTLWVWVLEGGEWLSGRWIWEELLGEDVSSGVVIGGWYVRGGGV